MKKILLLILALFSLGTGCEVANYDLHRQTTAQPVTEGAHLIEGIEINTLERSILKNDELKGLIKKKRSTNYAPRGTYTNIEGKEVPRPHYAPSIPTGASAVCKDGTYSFSQNRRGTCSHHGGVARWL